MFRVDSAPSETNDKYNIRYLNYDPTEEPTPHSNLCLVYNDEENVKIGGCDNSDYKNEWQVNANSEGDYHLIKSIDSVISNNEVYSPSNSPSSSQSSTPSTSDSHTNRYKGRCLTIAQEFSETSIGESPPKNLYQIKLSECQTNEVPNQQKVHIHEMGNIHECPEPEL